MLKCSGDIRTICGLAAAAAIIVACPARAEDASCRSTPDLSANRALALGHVTSAADRVHFVKDAAAQPGCPSRAPACAERAYLVPGDRVIISARRDVFICATYINAKGGARAGWLPADAVASDKAEPVALADWLGEWHHNDGADEGHITVKAGTGGALRIGGSATYGGNDPGRVERGDIIAAGIKSDVTPGGDRLSFTGDNDCKVWMQRLGPWLVANDDGKCGGDGATFRGVYTRQP
jgi:hypothetical protein